MSLPSWSIPCEQSVLSGVVGSQLWVHRLRKSQHIFLTFNIKIYVPWGEVPLSLCGWSVSTLIPLPTTNVNRFCWDRLLLQEVASTRGTGVWGVLVLDEAQERSVASDSLQGLLQDARLENLPGDLRVVVVTDPALEPKLRAFWGNPPIVRIPREAGERPSPIYRDTIPPDRVEAACQAVLELCRKEAPGDVLVYLPSEEVKKKKPAKGGTHHLLVLGNGNGSNAC